MAVPMLCLPMAQATARAAEVVKATARPSEIEGVVRAKAVARAGLRAGEVARVRAPARVREEPRVRAPARARGTARVLRKARKQPPTQARVGARPWGWGSSARSTL